MARVSKDGLHEWPSFVTALARLLRMTFVFNYLVCFGG
jgi:hypothetical protein